MVMELGFAAVSSQWQSPLFPEQFLSALPSSQSLAESRNSTKELAVPKTFPRLCKTVKKVGIMSTGVTSFFLL